MRRVVLRIADVGSPVLRLTGAGGWASGREGPNRKPRTLRKGQLNRHIIHVHNRDDATVKHLNVAGVMCARCECLVLGVTVCVLVCCE